MREFAGKTAFVTGGAAGIGLCARPGVCAGRHESDAGRYRGGCAAGRRQKPAGNLAPTFAAPLCDVADAASVERAAQATFEAFGKVHVVCNNAGVAAGGGIDHISLDNWRWVIDVNLMGVLHGIKSFLPHIRAHGEGGHIVNTASMAGMQTGLGLSPYGASKFAVVSMSEGLAISSSRTASASACCARAMCVPASARADAIGPRATASRSRSIRPVRRRPWWPRSPRQIWRRDSIPLPSPRACSPRSGRTNSIFSPIPACGPRSRGGLPPFWRRWTG